MLRSVLSGGSAAPLGTVVEHGEWCRSIRSSRSRASGMAIGVGAVAAHSRLKVGWGGSATIFQNYKARVLKSRGRLAVGLRAQGRLRNGLCLQCCFAMSLVTALGGTCAFLKWGRGGVVPRCKGQEVTASRTRLGPGTCVSRRVMSRGRDAACGRPRDRAGWLRIYAPTRIRRGQHQIVFRPLVRGAAYDVLTRWRFT